MVPLRSRTIISTIGHGYVFLVSRCFFNLVQPGYFREPLNPDQPIVLSLRLSQKNAPSGAQSTAKFVDGQILAKMMTIQVRMGRSTPSATRGFIQYELFNTIYDYLGHGIGRTGLH